MELREYRSQFIKTLTPLYDAEEADSFFYLILENKLQMKRVDLALNPKTEISSDQLNEWNQVLQQLENFIPIQYILGTAHFYGLEFAVNENVLIPRPETEELVDWIISNVTASGKSNIKILDIGTGSGCIAISLAKNLPHAKVSAIDISEAALATAKLNAENNNVTVNFLQKDILKTEDLAEQFDIIVSNPPYVRNLEKAEIKQNVLDNEPHLALFVDDNDALIFYRKITELAVKNLVSDGELFFEINQYLGKEMMDLLETNGFQQMELRKDIYGNNRMLYGKK